ncbi:hypothetical protein ES288_A07G058700v1 [Gossypium darwinii]|uniref:Retrovirus-related Pol polyprotein from transposon TNT 1-94-like beta-barrel domain-containing protein n=1 Tax=Gossypium darwinii TaxID=34276 RepID=A0A5D2FWB6_GOSDA|nr:hypothetical protein ES288_A07G058700v1 [Gossypium darwinii]
MCLADSATTHTILKDKKYFSHLTMSNAHVNTISGSSKLIEGSGRAIILLPKGTKFIIDDALYSTKSQRNLLSFKDIRLNGYHIETMNEKINIFWKGYLLFHQVYIMRILVQLNHMLLQTRSL